MKFVRKLSRQGLVHSLLSMLWLVFVWCALWQDFSLANLVLASILALAVLLIFRLPTLYLSDRFNPWYACTFICYFLGQVAIASLELFWVACTFRPPLHNSVLHVQLRTRSDLWLTAVSHAMSLIPGSVVVEVDRTNSILYFHVINVSTEAQAARFRAQAHRIEAMILQAVGSREEVRMLGQQKQNPEELKQGEKL